MHRRERRLGAGLQSFVYGNAIDACFSSNRGNAFCPNNIGQSRLQYGLIPIQDCLVDIRGRVRGILEIPVQLILDVQSSASSHVLAHLVRCSKSFSRARAFEISRSWFRLPEPPKSSTI